MLKNMLGIFRVVGFAEGISFVLLLFIAMPMKYMLDIPVAVTIVGALHGILFILYILAIIIMKFAYRWSIKKALLAGVASVVPFGPFIFDARLIQQEQEVSKKEVNQGGYR